MTPEHDEFELPRLKEARKGLKNVRGQRAKILRSLPTGDYFAHTSGFVVCLLTPAEYNREPSISEELNLDLSILELGRGQNHTDDLQTPMFPIWTGAKPPLPVKPQRV